LNTASTLRLKLLTRLSRQSLAFVSPLEGFRHGKIVVINKSQDFIGELIVSSQYLGVRAGLAPAQAGNRKGLPLLFEKIQLIDLLPPHLRPPLSVIEQERVSDYAVEARYPGDWEPITRTEAEDMVAIARRVCEVISPYLPDEL
jgi:hypothetical protein